MGTVVRNSGKWLVQSPAFLVLPLVVIIAIADPLFVSSGSIASLMQTFALVGLVAVGLACTMIVGEFDLSVAGVVPLAGLVALKAGDNPSVGLGAALLVGLVVGSVNGVLTARLHVSSLMVTVGSLFLVTGLGFIVADGNVVLADNFEFGLRLDQPVALILSARSIVTIAITVGLALFPRYTRFGVEMYAAGGNRHAAEVVGVRVTRAVVTAFIISAVCAALAGSLLAFSLASAAPTFDQTILLQAATAALAGGVALTGGRGGPQHAALGAVFITVLNGGLSFLNYSATAVQLANGAALMFVLLVVRLNEMKSTMSRPVVSSGSL